MTFGIRAYNSSGLLQIHEGYLIPEFIGKIITADDNIISNQGAESGFESRSYSGTAPNFGGRDVMIFWHLPEGVWWNMQDTFAYSGASGGAGFGGFAHCAPGTVISGAPVGYVFALGPTAPSAGQFGLRVWNAAGQLMFDSASPHLSAHQVPLVSYTVDTTTAVTLARTLPTKAAFMIPRVTRVEEDYAGTLSGDDFAHVRRWWGAVKVSGGVVSTRLLLVGDQDEPPAAPERAGYFEDKTYGNTSGLAMPIIDASIYD